MNQNDNRIPAIDLTRHAFVRPMGDITLYGTWVYNEDMEDYEPALVLIPSYRRSGFMPVVIALSAAYKYDSPQYLAKVSRGILIKLGMNDCMSSANRVANLIYDHLDDLLKMPNNPTTSVIVADATISINGRKRSVEILDFEPTKQL